MGWLEPLNLVTSATQLREVARKFTELNFIKKIDRNLNDKSTNGIENKVDDDSSNNVDNSIGNNRDNSKENDGNSVGRDSSSSHDQVLNVQQQQQELVEHVTNLIPQLYQQLNTMYVPNKSTSINNAREIGGREIRGRDGGGSGGGGKAEQSNQDRQGVLLAELEGYPWIFVGNILLL